MCAGMQWTDDRHTAGEGAGCTSLPMVARMNDRELAAGRHDTIRSWTVGNGRTIPFWAPPDPDRLSDFLTTLDPMTAGQIRVIGE